MLLLLVFYLIQYPLAFPSIGCDLTPEGEKKEQTAGCGGFGKVRASCHISNRTP